MKIEYVLKHAKLILWGMAVAFMAQIVFTAEVYAQTLPDQGTQELSTEERIELLSQNLILVGEVVAQSTVISDADRLILLTQLVELSRAIVALQRTAALNAAVESAIDRPVVIDAGPQVLPADIDLHRVSVQLDLDNFTADITEYYLDEDDDLVRDPFGVEYDRIERTVTLVEPGTEMSFLSTVEFAKAQIIEVLMENLRITDAPILNGIMFMSAYDPRRYDEITQNSIAAYSLLDNFGKYSLVTNVLMTTSDGYSRIEIHSDQQERLDLELRRGLDSNNNETYSFESSLYAGTLAEPFDQYGHNENISPIVYEISSDISQGTLLEIMNAMFAEVPFTGELIRADEKLLDFLVSNDACANNGDVVIVNEYTLQLLSGLRAGYIIEDLEITYPGPLSADDEFATEDNSCSGGNRFF